MSYLVPSPKDRFSVDDAETKDFEQVGYDLSLLVRKPVFGVFDLVPHKLGCTATEDG